jgi:hypothetical protein
MEILELLKQEYKTVTGLDWENNDTLKACFDLLTKSNTLGLANHTKLNGVYLKATSTGYVIEKTLVVPYDDPYGNAQTGIFTAYDYIDSNTNKL